MLGRSLRDEERDEESGSESEIDFKSRSNRKRNLRAPDLKNAMKQASFKAKKGARSALEDLLFGDKDDKPQVLQGKSPNVQEEETRDR